MQYESEEHYDYEMNQQAMEDEGHAMEEANALAAAEEANRETAKEQGIMAGEPLIMRGRKMIQDVRCPYCNEWQEIDHDDGAGYEEDVIHNQQCSDCKKVFTFTTSISFSYDAQKADCLNGADHKYEPTCTFPKEYTKMECVDCGERREPTEEEWKGILKEKTGDLA